MSAALPPGNGDSVPSSSVSTSPPPALKRLTPLDRVRLTNRVELALAFMPEPYPSEPIAEREAKQQRWREAHGSKDGDVPSVATGWRSEFAGLAVDVHSTLGGWPPHNPQASDLERVVWELLERAARVWEADWLFSRHRAYGNVPESQRQEAARWHVEDGNWVRETLEHLICSTLEQLEAFKAAVRRVVEAMVKSADLLETQPATTTTETRECPEEHGSGVADSGKKSQGASVGANPGSPAPTRSDSETGMEANAFPPFGRIFPEYVRCFGFRDRITARYYPNPPLPTLPLEYRHGPSLPPRNRLMEWFEALNGVTMWERAAALLDFRVGNVGGFEDIVALECWGRSLLRHFIERPEHAFVVSVLVFKREPDLRLTTPEFGSLISGADRDIPVLDRRTDPGGWMFPWIAGEGWAVNQLREHAEDEIDAPRFCLALADALERTGDVSTVLTRSVLVYRKPAPDRQPDAVLRRLVDTLWEAMRDVSIRERLTTPAPPRPPSTAAPIDRFHATFDALGNWLRETRRLHPEFVEPIYAAMRGGAEQPPSLPAPEVEVMASASGPSAGDSHWLAGVEARVAEIYCQRPTDLDPALADVFEAVAVAVRECTRLIASVPFLWQRPAEYRRLAQEVSGAVERARTAYFAVDIRLRRTGGPNAVLDALNDTLSIRQHAPPEELTIRELNPVWAALYTARDRWFTRVEGKGIIDRMLDQLARVPPVVTPSVDESPHADEESTTAANTNPDPNPDNDYTVADARDLLRYRRESARQLQTVKDNPMLAVQRTIQVILPPVEQAKLNALFRKLDPPRMPEQAVIGSAVFALLRNAARQECGRELDEDALDGLVAGVVLQTGRTMPDVWRLSLAEFGRLKWPNLENRPHSTVGTEPSESNDTKQSTSPASVTGTGAIDSFGCDSATAAERALWELARQHVEKNNPTVTAGELADSLRPLGLEKYRTHAILALEARRVLIPEPKPEPTGIDFTRALKRMMFQGPSSWRIGPGVLDNIPPPPERTKRDVAPTTTLPVSPSAPVPTPSISLGGDSVAWVSRCDGALRCSRDYGTVQRGDVTFTFTDTQRACIKGMIEAWENGRREFTNKELLDFAGSSGDSIRSTFRPNGKASPAWNNLIVEVEGKKGRYTIRVNVAS